MNRNMRKMYTEEQIAEIVKKNSTKLYKHVVWVEDNEFTIYSKQKESFVNTNIYDVFTDSDTITIRYTGGDCQTVLAIDDQGIAIYYYDYAGGTIGSVGDSTLQIREDTITEL